MLEMSEMEKFKKARQIAIDAEDCYESIQNKKALSLYKEALDILAPLQGNLELVDALVLMGKCQAGLALIYNELSLYYNEIQYYKLSLIASEREVKQYEELLQAGYEDQLNHYAYAKMRHIDIEHEKGKHRKPNAETSQIKLKYEKFLNELKSKFGDNPYFDNVLKEARQLIWFSYKINVDVSN